MPVAAAFAVLEVGGSASDIGLVLGFTALARVLFQLAAGVLGDRVPRRPSLLNADAAQGAVQAVVAVALLTGHGSVPLLAVAGVAFGVANALSGPALTGFVPRLVPAADLGRANALLSLTRSIMFVAGPAVSGVAVALFGAVRAARSQWPRWRCRSRASSCSSSWARALCCEWSPRSCWAM